MDNFLKLISINVFQFSTELSTDIWGLSMSITEFTKNAMHHHRASIGVRPKPPVRSRYHHLYQWGDLHRLGTGFAIPTEAPEPPKMVTLPLPMTDIIVSKLCTSGGTFGALLSSKGEVIIYGNCWGIMDGACEGQDNGAIIQYPDCEIHDIAIGYSHILSLDTEGRVHSYGVSSSGCLGMGPHCSHLSVPTIISPLVPIVSLSSSDRHVAMVAATGQLLTFGSSKGGALGHGSDNGDEMSPRVVQSLSGEYILKSFCGPLCTFVIAEVETSCESVKVFSFGIGSDGRLGHGNTDSYWIPQRIMSLPDSIVDISCGGSHCLALTQNGSVYSWGNPGNGRLGRLLVEPGIAWSPGVITSLSNLKVSSVAAGGFHSCIVTSCGKLYMFGRSQTQSGIPSRNYLEPHLLSNSCITALDPVSVHCGKHFSILIAHSLTFQAPSHLPTQKCTKELDITKTNYMKVDVVDNRYKQLGLSSRADYYNFIALDDLFADSLDYR